LQNNIFSTLFVGQNLIKLPEVDSTNNFLKMLVSNSEPLAEGTVIMADNQFAGRGQQGNIWLAEPGMNLTVSLLLKPIFLDINSQFLLNMVISIAIKEALTALVGQGITIKWPNDLYFNDRKVGGILIENALSGSVYKTCIIGIGINVNQRTFGPHLSGTAISLSQILQQDVNLVQLLTEICSHIESGYLRLKAHSYLDLRSNYLKNLYKWEKNFSYRYKGLQRAGRITDVTDQGLLIINENGNIYTYNFKEIEFLTHNT
jgi:BirA family biotin operon repressor/biotin-[acetyl-CoA-carboxylase] ligase